MGHPDRSIFLVEDLVDHIYKENQNTSLHRIPLHSTSLLRMTAPLVFWALALLGTKFHSKLNQKLGQFSRKLVAHPDIQFDNFLMCYHFCKLKYSKLVFDYQDDLIQKKSSPIIEIPIIYLSCYYYRKNRNRDNQGYTYR